MSSLSASRNHLANGPGPPRDPVGERSAVVQEHGLEHCLPVLSRECGEDVRTSEAAQAETGVVFGVCVLEGPVDQVLVKTA
jgi:hypothetical protein